MTIQRKTFIFSLFFFLSGCLTLEIPESISLTPYESLSAEKNTGDTVAGKMIPVTGGTKKRKNIVTYYYGEELIRKKIQWKGKEDYEIHLRGNALIQHEDITVHATSIVIDPDNNAKIYGRMVVADKKNGMYLYAGGGFYSRSEEYILIPDHPYLEMKNNQENILITTKEIRRNIAEKTLELKEYVKIYGKDWVLLADNGYYKDEEKVFYLKEYPVLAGKDMYLSSRMILYYPEEQKVSIPEKPFFLTFLREGNLEKKEESGKGNKTQETGKKDTEKKPEKEIMYIQAGFMEYYLGTPKNVPYQGRVSGGVEMVSRTKHLKGEEFFLYGRQVEKLESRKKVTVHDKKEKFLLEANFFQYDFKREYLVLQNNARLMGYENNPEEIHQELRAKSIEFDIKNNKLIAKNDVYFKRKQEEVFAEYGEFDDKNERMILLGSPVLRQNGTEIRTKVVNVYKDRITFEKEMVIQME